MTDGPFDRRVGLRDLLEGLPYANLTAALGTLCGPDFCLQDETHQLVVQGAAWRGDCADHAALTLELEVIGWICLGRGAPVEARATVGIIELLVLAAARYRMTAALHAETVQEDYRVLLEKHGELAASEARYRLLSETLEQRVQEQVGTIEAAQRQLFLAEKMASVGQLAAGMAHEINNPISFIRSNLCTAEAYLRRLGRLEEAAQTGNAEIAEAWRSGELSEVICDFNELLQESVAGADRIARIVADLKSFSSIDRPQESVLDLNESLRSVATLALAQSGGQVEIQLNLQPLPPFTGDAGRLNQAFLNLVQNALQAVSPGATIWLESSSSDAAICVRVRDLGCGMPPQVLQRAFDPFFTTRPVGKGTGLGLSVSRDTILAHDGQIDIASAPGEGTSVTVTLPVTPQRGA